MNVLFVAAHPDDIEFGCYGAVLKHLNAHDTIHYLIASDCLDLPGNHTVLDESEEAVSIIGPETVTRLSLPNTMLPTTGNSKRLRKALEKYRELGVDVVYTHWPGDIHQDHEAVGNESVRVFRYKSVLFYENQHSCPKLVPDRYLVLPEKYARLKLEALRLFRSQQKRDIVKKAHKLMTYRGSEIEEKYAEGFKVWREIEHVE